MTSRQEEIHALRAGKPLPADSIIQMRSTGMHAIRFEFIYHLLRSGVKVDTLSVYWERGNEFMLKGEVASESRRLVLRSKPRVTGEFADLWLLCYPDDNEIKDLVDREVDRMVDRALRKGAG